MKRLVVPTLVSLVGAACVDEEEPRLLAPDGIEVAWEDAYNLDGDGLGALVPVDVMAYDSASGEPLAGVELLVWTDNDGAWPVPTEGVWLVDADQQGSEEPAFWDAARDQFVNLELADDPLRLETDASGLARAYVYVDSFPATATGFAPMSAVVGFESDGFMGGADQGSASGGEDAGEDILLHPW